VIDFYLVLGLSRDASLTDVKRAYRRLARKYHPDINPGDRIAAAQFRRLAEAYETLSDPDLRRRYDSGEVGQAVEEVAFGFEGFDFSARVSGASASTFGDLFADVLKARVRASATGVSQRGADVHHTITLPFEAALRGGQHNVTLTRQESCRACTGTGRVRTAEGRCPSCQGAGVVKSARGHMVFSKPCPVCHGTGRREDIACPVCGGRQTEMRAMVLTVDLPPGLADGERVRVAGQGNAGWNGGESGDLHITARVEPHPLFRRVGDDLHLQIPLAIHEAALGAKVEIPSLDGPTRLRVPPGTQSGQRFRLRERGVPSSRSGRRGDLVVEVRLVLPQLIDERSKELLREFGRINNEDVRKELAGK
jgi:molecular chaperone DnaJ